MDEPLWSGEALEDLSEYFDNKVIIYVEGDTDRVFYSTLLKFVSLPKWHILEAGGKEEIKKYASDIVEMNLNIVILTDLDYSQYIDDGIEAHERIVRTKGHSIENMLLSPEVVGRIVELKSRSFEDFSQDFNTWRTRNFLLLTELIALDILNQRDCLGKVIIDRNYDQYTINKRNCDLSDDKINTKVLDLKRDMEMDESVSRSISESRHMYKIIRGHFYQKAVRSYIIWKVNSVSNRKVNISDDEVFDLALSIINSNVELIEEVGDFLNEVSVAFKSIGDGSAA